MVSFSAPKHLRQCQDICHILLLLTFAVALLSRLLASDPSSLSVRFRLYQIHLIPPRKTREDSERGTSLILQNLACLSSVERSVGSLPNNACKDGSASHPTFQFPTVFLIMDPEKYPLKSSDDGPVANSPSARHDLRSRFRWLKATCLLYVLFSLYFNLSQWIDREVDNVLDKREASMIAAAFGHRRCGRRAPFGKKAEEFFL